MFIDSTKPNRGHVRCADLLHQQNKNVINVEILDVPDPHIVKIIDKTPKSVNKAVELLKSNFDLGIKMQVVYLERKRQKHS